MLRASEDLVELAKDKAAQLLEAASGDVVLDTSKGVFHVAGRRPDPRRHHNAADSAPATNGVETHMTPRRSRALKRVSGRPLPN